MQNVERLLRVSLFAGLGEQDLKVIGQHAFSRQYSANTVIVQEGGSSDTLYAITTGRVKVFIGDEDGAEVILAFLGPNEVFGEMALVDDGPRSASVMTLEPTELVSIPKIVFNDKLLCGSTFAHNLVKTLSGRIRLLNENVKSLALLDVYGRIARILLKLSTPQGERMMVEQRLTHQELANMVGSSREMVSRIMKDLERGGYISMENRCIIINEKLPRGY